MLDNVTGPMVCCTCTPCIRTLRHPLEEVLGISPRELFFVATTFEVFSRLLKAAESPPGMR